MSRALLILTIIISVICYRLEIRNAELNESRKPSRVGPTKSSSSYGVEESEDAEEEESDLSDEEQRARKLSQTLQNCGDVLERPLFDAIFW